MGKSIYSQRLDKIQSEINTKILIPNGFRKKGRTHNRITSDSLVQVINFQMGQCYRDENDMFSVNIGIRVPESFERTFSSLGKTKDFYQEYECNIRTSITEPWGTPRYKAKNGLTYNAEMFLLDSEDYQPIIDEIVEKFEKYIFPFFDDLDTREKVINNRMKYSNIDMFSHLCFLEEAMIYGYAGNIEKATQLMQKHYDNSNSNKGHKEYIEELCEKLGIVIEKI
jgi:hypothetical protein